MKVDRAEIERYTIPGQTAGSTPIQKRERGRSGVADGRIPPPRSGASFGKAPQGDVKPVKDRAVSEPATFDEGTGPLKPPVESPPHADDKFWSW